MTGHAERMMLAVKRVVLAVFAIALLAAVAKVADFFVRLRRAALVKQTRYGNMATIGDGILEFNTRHGRLPTNLEEVIRHGYLPEESFYYANPLRHETFQPESIPFLECEFDLDFRSNEVEIRIPDGSYNAGKFGRIIIQENSLCCTVSAETKLILEPRPEVLALEKRLKPYLDNQGTFRVRL